MAELYDDESGFKTAESLQDVDAKLDQEELQRKKAIAAMMSSAGWKFFHSDLQTLKNKIVDNLIFLEDPKRLTELQATARSYQAVLTLIDAMGEEIKE